MLNIAIVDTSVLQKRKSMCGFKIIFYLVRNDYLAVATA